MSEHGHRTDGWQLTKRGPEAYEQYLVPSLFAPWAERLIDRVNLEAVDRVLDVGCGTGIVARRAASRVGDEGTVVGLDVNDEMLDVAGATTSEGRLSIEWRHGDATELPFDDKSFGVVVSQQVLQFVSDPRAALREIRRVLAPDGRVAVGVWRPIEFNPGYVELSEVLEHYLGTDAGDVMCSPFPSWGVDDLRVLARDAGFGEPSITIEVGSVRYPSVEEFVRREAASSPSSESLDNLLQEDRKSLVHDVEDALREYIDDEGVTFPMESYILTAQEMVR